MGRYLEKSAKNVIQFVGVPLTCVLNKVIEDAKAPLQVGPGSLRFQKLCEVGQQLLEGGKEGLAVRGEHGVHDVTDL